MAAVGTWAISGTYLESCNCDPICPCRRVSGTPGSRSTHGECMGALSWWVVDGHLDDVDLAGLGAVLVMRYSDDEAGSPWTHALYVDDRGDERQRAALAAILTGQLGGTLDRQAPWVFKASASLGWQAATLELDHTPGRGWFRVKDRVVVRVSAPVTEPGVVTCLIPGHDREGRELQVETLSVHEGPLAFDLTSVCAYESTFAYSSAAA